MTRKHGLVHEIGVRCDQRHGQSAYAIDGKPLEDVEVGASRAHQNQMLARRNVCHTERSVVVLQEVRLGKPQKFVYTSQFASTTKEIWLERGVKNFQMLFAQVLKVVIHYKASLIAATFREID